jgi:hypothetical protein
MATVISIRSQDCSWSSLFTYITPLPTIGCGLGSCDDPKAVRSCARIANRAKKIPLPTTRRIGWMIK